MAQEARYSTQGAYGLKKCLDSNSAIVDIIFVHGLTGNRETTWTDKNAKVFWPEALLRNDIPDARILTFGYDADIVHFWSMTSQNRIGNHAQNLLNVLAQLRERSETALLSSKNSAEPHLQQIIECTVGITFLGTPHCGADLANWAKIFGNVTNMFKTTNTRLLETLKPDSEVLAWIQKDFHTMLRSRQKEGKDALKITCFYEELPTRGIGEIVPMHSAILPSYNSIGIHKNHLDMTKYSGEGDPGYIAVSTELWRWVKEIKTQRQLVQEHEARFPRESSPTMIPQPSQRAFPPEYFPLGYGQSGLVIQGGNTISRRAGSGSGKGVQGNNIKSDGDVNFNM